MDKTLNKNLQVYTHAAFKKLKLALLLKKRSREWSGKIPRKSLSIWCSQLSRLLQAGLSLNEAMDLIVQTQTDKKIVLLTKILKNLVSKGNGIYQSLLLISEQGISGADSKRIRLRLHPGLLVAFEVGEATGTLAKNTQEAGERLRLEDEFIKKITSLLIYPAIVSVAAIGMVVFLIGYIFPKIMPVFSGMKMKLPIATRAMIAVVNLGKSWGWLIILIFILVTILLLVLWRNNLVFRSKVMSLLLHLPKFGTLWRLYISAQLSRFLVAYIASGQSLSQALHTHTTRNILLSDKVKLISHAVENGSHFSDALRSADTFGPQVFPIDMCSYIAIGERSGSLSNSLELVIDLYEKKIKTSLESFASIIEPILMVFIGIFVGWISLSIILPMYQVTEHVGK